MPMITRSMGELIFRRVGAAALAALLLPPVQAVSDPAAEREGFQAGYYARRDNDGPAAEATGHNIYIKFLPDSWIATLYVPYPYAADLDAGVLHGVFEEIGRLPRSSSFTRSRFGLLAEPAVVHLEPWRREGDRFLFDCGGRAPCVVEFADGSMRIVRRGIIGEKVTEFDHVVE